MTFITLIKSKWFPYILLAIAIAVLGFMYQHQQNLKIRAQVDLQNESALYDSLRIVKNKNGDLEASKASFIASEKDLRALNSDLADAVDAEKGKVVSLGRIVFKLKQDTSLLRKSLVDQQKPAEEPVQINDSTYHIPWDLMYVYDSTNYDYYIGVTEIEIGVGNPYKVRHIFTELKSRESRINLTFGQKVEDGQLRVFANSDYPGFAPEQLQGVLIDPNKNPFIKGLIKKKHWFTGLGVGFSGTLGYDMFSGKPGLVFGPSIHYTLYQW